MTLAVKLWEHVGKRKESRGGLLAWLPVEVGNRNINLFYIHIQIYRGLVTLRLHLTWGGHPSSHIRVVGKAAEIVKGRHDVLGKAWILEADRQTCIQTLALPFNSCMTLGKSTSWKLFTFPVVLLWGWSETTCRESRSATVLCYGFLPCQVSLVISWGHTWGM